MTSEQQSEPIVRPFEPGDRDGLLRLRKLAYWEDVDSGRPDFFEWQYGKNPAGRGIVTVVEVDGEIVGELGALPTPFKLDTDTTTALMYVNFIVKPGVRSRGMGVALDRVQIEQELEKDLWLMLGFVRVTNAPQLRVQTEKCGRLRLVDPSMCFRILRPIPLFRAAAGNPRLGVVLGALAAGPMAVWNAATRPRPVAPELEIRRIQEPDTQFDGLWERISGHYKYAVIKDRPFMSWRFFKDPRQCYRTAGAFRGDELVGAVTTRVAEWEGIRIGVILELLVDPSDNPTAGALVAEAVDAAGDEVDMICCMLQAKGAAPKALSKAGFLKPPARLNPYGYVLVGDALDRRTDLAPLVSPDDWHISWGDFDVF